MKSKYDYDIIRDYLHGLTDRETSQRIRELIRTDEVARNIASGILQLEHDFKGDESQIESYIDSLLQKQLDVINKQPKTRTMEGGWMKVAAAILLVALIGSALLLFLRKNDVLEKELSEPYPIVALRGDPDENAAFDFYVKGQYQKAIEAFGKMEDNATVTFYSGLSHLYAGEYNEAARLLVSPSLDASRYREQAGWFEAVALYKSGDKQAARKILVPIAEDKNHFKSSVARELLSALEDDSSDN